MEPPLAPAGSALERDGKRAVLIPKVRLSNEIPPILLPLGGVIATLLQGRAKRWLAMPVTGPSRVKFQH